MTESRFPVRRFFEMVLGPGAMPYLLHLRPLEWPIMSAHFLLGTLLAAGWTLSASPTLLGWFVFVALMNGGTLAINSAFDQDEGDIGYLKSPPKPPRHLAVFASWLLGASALLGFLLPLPFALINLGCVVMSVLYSVPPPRLKARAGWDLLINCVGFGLLTPLAGWALTGRPFTRPILLASLGFAFLFATLYPMTQIYQVAEDSRRGDRTLVIQVGIGRSLALALLAALLAHGFFLAGILTLGGDPQFLIPSLVGWSAVLLPWLRGWRTWTDRQHEAGMYWGLAAWATTDLSLLALLWP
ncbi:MAG: UbiA prenyltransferase family protein [Holophagaceae bacterium]|uniref:UbiA prenyltransferase family protein n=1 Tax=Candidatus Geothrix odensensis TaxID=2954440 RepID=A0A936EZK8_9BACT|nr:UbiA prenyltransferase family protein [Candidatus Geothrix odensensis]